MMEEKITVKDILYVSPLAEGTVIKAIGMKILKGICTFGKVHNKTECSPRI